MTYLDASRLALEEEMRRDSDVWVVGEDVAKGGLFGQYKDLPQKFGMERFADTAISEAAIMGASVGAAMAGTRPITEMRFADFVLCAIDELVNQAAKARYMLGGQVRVPLVARLPTGAPGSYAAQHSQCLEAWWVHTPGLLVAMPATPADSKGLFKAAIRCDDPVVYMEHKSLLGAEGEVPDDPDYVVPLGRCRVAREGSDVTIISWSRTVLDAETAAQELESRDGISAEVVDLRTLWPWDEEGVCRSAEKTGHVLIVHEAVVTGGFGAELYASIHTRLGGRLRRIRRLGAPRAPTPFSPPLEAVCRITADGIAQAARAMLRER